MIRRRPLLAAGAASLIAGGGAVRAQQGPAIDLVLALCMDASGSIDAEEFELQRRGYAEAIVDPRILDSVTGGAGEAVAMCIVEWGSPAAAATVVPWMLVRDRASAQAFADAIMAAPRSNQSYNAIGDALEHCTKEILSAPYVARRRVIDLSGDGPDMRSLKPAWRARDEAVAQGVTINALAILGSSALRGDQLVAHYERDVIGGPGAFVIAAETRRRFGQALRAKLVREISALDGPMRA
jgi:hypothetical protein